MNDDSATTKCEMCWLPARITLNVERLGFFLGRVYVPGPLHLCMKHARMLDEQLRRHEAHLA